jgi:hypothetical protein
VSWTEVIVGTVLGAGLATLAVVTTLLQLRTLRNLRRQQELPAEEKEFLRIHARLRLATSGLLLLMAGLLGSAQGFLGPPMQDILKEGETVQQSGDATTSLSEPNRKVLRAYLWFYIAILLVLLAIVVLVGVDLWSLRRYALREQRQLLEDRRDMIARQANRMRRERNELN